LRHIIRGLGSRDTNRSDMIATLLFQPLFIRKMIEVGERDGAQRAAEVGAFLNMNSEQSAAVPSLPERVAA
jgi:hypothetical protein